MRGSDRALMIKPTEQVPWALASRTRRVERTLSGQSETVSGRLRRGGSRGRWGRGCRFGGDAPLLVFGGEGDGGDGGGCGDAELVGVVGDEFAGAGQRAVEASQCSSVRSMMPWVMWREVLGPWGWSVVGRMLRTRQEAGGRVSLRVPSSGGRNWFCQ